MSWLLILTQSCLSGSSPTRLKKGVLMSRMTGLGMLRHIKSLNVTCWTIVYSVQNVE